MKIGIIVSFYDFRADVRDLIGEFQKSGHQVVLFYRDSEGKDIARHPIEGLEYRKIKEENRNLRNRLLEYAFLFFKRLPSSRQNYFLMELFKISNNSAKGSRIFSQVVLFIQRLRLNFVSYDFLLENLQYSAATPIEDIDHFIGFTEFQSDYFAARLLHENRPLSIYVYSWDHPCKHTRFSRKFHYQVWSPGIREDLIRLQGVPEANVSVAGATQFSYLWEYQHKPAPMPRPVPFRYVYFCCAIGIKDLIPMELDIIRSIAAELEKLRPDWKLFVRPYPVLNQWEIYQPLRSLPNVLFDDGFRTNPFPNHKAANFDKFLKLESAELVLHSGSTIGLEACFLNVPAALVDFGYGKQRSGLSVYGFIHQYQNEKYLLDLGLAMKSASQLSDLLDNPEVNLAQNRKAASEFHLLPLERFVSLFIRKAESGVS